MAYNMGQSRDTVKPEDATIRVIKRNLHREDALDPLKLPKATSTTDLHPETRSIPFTTHM
jgi:hypothetical protein